MSTAEAEESDEEDYMSANFVAESQNAKTTLLWSQRQKVELERHKKKLQHTIKSKKDMASIEVTNRQAALNKPIEADNKGYLLLQKMMTKRAAGNTDNSTSITDDNKKATSGPSSSTVTEEISHLIAERAPISIELKTNRRGLGESSLPLRKRVKYTQPTEAEREHLNQQRASDFLAAKRTKTAALLTRKDYFKCQKVCANLEAAQDSPSVEWYWPKAVIDAKKKTSSKEESEEQVVEEEVAEEDFEDIDYPVRLAELNGYLRNTYHYCIWCAVSYDSPEELDSSCPGDTREDHDA